MGELTKIDLDQALDAGGGAAQPPPDPNVKVGEEQPQCGVKESCSPDSFPVHMYSGKGNTEGPKICVSGK